MWPLPWPCHMLRALWFCRHVISPVISPGPQGSKNPTTARPFQLLEKGRVEGEECLLISRACSGQTCNKGWKVVYFLGGHVLSYNSRVFLLLERRMDIRAFSLLYPLECKLHKNRISVLFYHYTPPPRTVPGTFVFLWPFSLPLSWLRHYHWCSFWM